MNGCACGSPFVRDAGDLPPVTEDDSSIGRDPHAERRVRRARVVVVDPGPQ